MATADHHYAEMLGIMREQGKKDNPITLQLGIVEAGNKVRLNDLLLEAEDLYISKQLKGNLIDGDLVVVQQLYNSDMFVILERVVRA